MTLLHPKKASKKKKKSKAQAGDAGSNLSSTTVLSGDLSPITVFHGPQYT